MNQPAKPTSGRGGYREGAGRKSSPDSLKPVLVKLPPDVIAWLHRHRAETGTPINLFIRNAIQEKIAHVKRKPRK